MKKDFIVRRSIIIIEGKPHVETYSEQELIRCKNCKYCVKEPNGELYCDILAVEYEPFGSKKVTADWFCADGKRRE